MLLYNETLQDKAFWEKRAYRLPAFDRAAMTAKTVTQPVWLHFGAGNIFKAFQADACQRLLDAGLADTGITAVDRRPKKPEEDDTLIREKYVELAPITVDEALVQIDLIGHDFYMFEDSVTGLVNVVYRRKDGGYGIIKPKIEDEDE